MDDPVLLGAQVKAAAPSVTQPWPPKDRGYAGAWGYDRDLSGLYHVGVRAYDPALGRFLQRDEVEDAAGQPYAYVDNTPTGFVDPDGRAKLRVPNVPSELESRLRDVVIEFGHDPALLRCSDAFGAMNYACGKEYQRCLRGLWRWVPGRGSYCQQQLILCRWRAYRCLIQCLLDLDQDPWKLPRTPLG